jgi:hypothetical protein
LALPVTLNWASPRLVSALIFQPSSTLWEPIVNALPGVTSRGRVPILLGLLRRLLRR